MPIVQFPQCAECGASLRLGQEHSHLTITLVGHPLARLGDTRHPYSASHPGLVAVDHAAELLGAMVCYDHIDLTRAYLAPDALGQTLVFAVSRHIILPLTPAYVCDRLLTQSHLLTQVHHWFFIGLPQVQERLATWWKETEQAIRDAGPQAWELRAMLDAYLHPYSVYLDE